MCEPKLGVTWSLARSPAAAAASARASCAALRSLGPIHIITSIGTAPESATNCGAHAPRAPSQRKILSLSPEILSKS
jgi:hypothetical protein